MPGVFAKLGALGRNTWLFFAAQGVAMTTLNINVIIVGLAGFEVAPEKWLATLPLSLMFVASMLTTLPASLLMGRVGRKPVFAGGIGLIALGMAGQGAALLLGSFALFVLASMSVGMAHGIAQFYRYAAADTVDEAKKPVVVSLVLAGGLVAAFMGATIVTATIGFFPAAIYAACFFAAASLQCISLPVILAVKAPPLVRAKTGGRSLGYFFRMPRYVAALVTAALGYAVMAFLMTAAPLQIVLVSGLGDAANARVIQWHVVAMFAPSFFTGALIKRFGGNKVIAAGLIAYALAVAILVGGTSFRHYFIVLFLVGLGWNALYVTGSSIIAQIAAPVERAKVQGISDFIITVAITTASLSAGILHYTIGWQKLGLGALIPVAVIAALTAFAVVYDRKGATWAS